MIRKGRHRFSTISARKKEASNLDQCRVQIDVVWHDDGAHDPYCLLQLIGPTALTVRQEHPLQQVPLVWLHHYILRQATGINV